jgi:hypothetical protein
VFRVYVQGLRVMHLRFTVYSLQFRVWDSGFGAYDLESRAEG